MRRSVLVVAAASVAAAALITTALAFAARPTPASVANTVVPEPVSQIHMGGSGFVFDDSSDIVARGEFAPVGRLLGDYLRPVLGLRLPLISTGNGGNDVHFVRAANLAPEEYRIRVAQHDVTISASTPAGAFRAVQTLRQLVVPHGRAIATTAIRDQPRFAYRGAMLDVARHFFPVQDVERYLDDIALLKLNVLHLHLSDDQGWRIAIEGYPRLTAIGGASQVGDVHTSTGGFYTQEQYRQIVRYAAARYITIVPEIDMPGHVNAALTSLPGINADGISPARYTGMETGFSSLGVHRPETYAFVTAVLDQLAALTPGPYLHIGGDESQATSPTDYRAFVARAAAIVAATGKTVIGWHQLGASDQLPRGTIGQYWGFVQPDAVGIADARSIVAQGGRLIMSPADVAYLDQKYDILTKLGLNWAGFTSLTDSYSWDPAAVIPGIGDPQVLGVEAPLWTETLSDVSELEQMAFPRIAAIAEIGWSSPASHDLTGFLHRMRAFQSLLGRLGIDSTAVRELR